VEQLPPGSLDLIVSNSMVQYLSTADLDRMLALWRRLLAPGGALIVADVIPPDVGALSDVVALLRYAATNGFLLAALIGLARTTVSPYRKLRNRLGIARYTEAEFMARLAAAGFRAERLARNMEHNPARMTFRALPV
jgi:SAM-dependent methyltransferase